MIPLKLISDIKTIVSTFVENTNYIHSKFVFTTAGTLLVPVTDVEAKYPAVFSQANSISISKDMRIEFANLTISYLRPSSDSLEDVPETLLKGTNAINTILYELTQTGNLEYTLESEPLFTSVMHETSELLSGVTCNVIISMTNNFNPCC
jgi:hypothetical protein